MREREYEREIERERGNVSRVHQTYIRSVQVVESRARANMGFILMLFGVIVLLFFGRKVYSVFMARKFCDFRVLFCQHCMFSFCS